MNDGTKWRPGPRGGKLVVTGKGQRRGGRQKGTPNKISPGVKESILLAAELVGEDGRGKGGLVGYMWRVARDEPKAFARILIHILKGTSNNCVLAVVRQIRFKERTRFGSGGAFDGSVRFL